MSNIWIYHHFDADGYASAVVIANKYTRLTPLEKQIETKEFQYVEMPENVHLISVNYDKDIDFSKIEEGDDVYILDYTPDRKNDIIAINKLWETYGSSINFILVDHHKTALKGIEECEGLKNYLRISGGVFYTEKYNQSGCMLVYIMEKIGVDMFSMLFRHEYFGEELPFEKFDIKEKFDRIEKDAPMWLKWTGDHDIYSEKYPESHIFSTGVYDVGVQHIYTDLKNPDSFITRMKLCNDTGVTNDGSYDVYQHGLVVKSIIDRQHEKLLNRSFEVYINLSVSKDYIDPTDSMHLDYNKDGMITAEGKCLCVNGVGNSSVFLNRFEEYDAVILFSYNGENVIYSIFSKKDSTFPCNVLALWGGKFFGISGGGHDHAAGFSTEDDLFFRKDRLYYLSDHRWKIFDKHDIPDEDFKKIFGREKD